MGLFNGFVAAQGGIRVNHLHYADDTIFFVDNNWDELYNLFSILKNFEFVSGLKVNTAKTRLIAIGNVPDINLWATSLGCLTDTLPFLYLGMPLGAKANSKFIWNPIIEKFDTRLSPWRKLQLTKGGKLVLIKCILSSLPLYYFSIFKAPISVINILETKIKNFLWESSTVSKVSHLVNYDVVCLPKQLGGLGVLSLRKMNQAMLAKWGWKYGVEKSHLWYRIIRDKYGPSPCVWTPADVEEKFGIDCWKAIAREAASVDAHSQWHINSGLDIAFWYDSWVGMTPLKNVCPLLFKIVRHKGVKLRECILQEDGVLSWKFDFKRSLKEEEVNQFGMLLHIIGDQPPQLNEGSDVRRWSLTSDGIFNVKSLYEFSNKVGGDDNFPSTMVWNSAIPSKVNFFFWCAVHHRLNTIDRLNDKGIMIHKSCIMCGCEEESVSHLILHCKVVWKIWCLLTPKKNWCWVCPETVYKLAHSWFMPSSLASILQFIPAAVTWVVWNERNKRTFEEDYLFVSLLW